MSCRAIASYGSGFRVCGSLPDSQQFASGSTLGNVTAMCTRLAPMPTGTSALTRGRLGDGRRIAPSRGRRHLHARKSAFLRGALFLFGPCFCASRVGLVCARLESPRDRPNLSPQSRFAGLSLPGILALARATAKIPPLSPPIQPLTKPRRLRHEYQAAVRPRGHQAHGRRKDVRRRHRDPGLGHREADQGRSRRRRRRQGRSTTAASARRRSRSATRCCSASTAAPK